MTKTVRMPDGEPFWAHLFMFLFGAGWAFSINVGFRIYAAELVAIAALCLLGNWTAFQRHKMASKVVFIYLIWCVGIVVSDLYNETSILDSLRNLSTPFLGAIGLIFVVRVLSQAPKSLASFLISVVLFKGIFGEPAYGDAFAELSFGIGSVLENTNYFKVRFEPFITPLALLISFYLSSQRMPKLISLWLMCVSLIYFSVDARSSGLIFFITALIVYCIQTGFRPKASHILVGGGVSVFFLYGAYFAYVRYTLSGSVSGHNALQLLALQNPYNPFSLLLYGRGDWMVIPQAFFERPLFGWGSWAVDHNNRFELLKLERLGGSSVQRVLLDPDDRYIPVHSMLGSAIVWTGTIGLIVMLLLVSNFFKMFRKLLDLNSAFFPVVVCFSITIAWHFLFSPPQHLRITFPYALGSLIVFSNRATYQKFKSRLGYSANLYNQGKP